MKTQYLFFTFFFCVFVLIANAQVSSLGVFHTLEHTGTVFSPNGEWMAKTIDSYIDPTTGSDENGGTFVFHKNASNYNYTQTAVYTLLKGQGADSGVVIGGSMGTAINNNGDVFNYFQDDVVGNTPSYKLYKNNTQIDALYDLGCMAMHADDNALYLFLVDNNNTRILRKYDANSGAFIWETSFASSYAIKILGTETSNIYVQMNDGRLIEIDPTNGAILGTPVTPTPGHEYGTYNDYYQINSNDVIERYDVAAKKLKLENGEVFWDNPTVGAYTFWDNDVNHWIKINNLFYAFSGNVIYVLSSDYKHGYMKKIVNISNNERILDYYVYTDGSVTFINSVFDCNSCTYGHVYTKHYTFPTPIPIPNVDASQPEIEAVHMGQSYVNGSFVTDYERIATLVINDSDMLTEGETAPAAWFPQPADINYVIPEKVQTDTNDNLFFRVVYYKNNWYQHNLFVKIISHSALSTDEVVKDVENLGFYNPREEAFIINPDMNIIGGVVYDVVGKEIKHFSQEDSIPMIDLSAGMYVLRAQNDSGTIFSLRIFKY